MNQHCEDFVLGIDVLYAVVEGSSIDGNAFTAKQLLHILLHLILEIRLEFISGTGCLPVKATLPTGQGLHDGIRVEDSPNVSDTVSVIPAFHLSVIHSGILAQ